MKIGIVGKLFLLTTALCTLILAVIYIGQTIFFKEFYKDRKTKEIQANIEVFKKDYLSAKPTKDDIMFVWYLEEMFFQDHNTWITTLDRYGNLKYTNDFFLQVQLDNDKSYESFKVPLHHLININDLSSSEFVISLEQQRLIISGIKKDATIMPIRIQDKFVTYGTNDQPLIMPSFEDKATVIDFQIPAPGDLSHFIFSNSLFMERIKVFQADLLWSNKPQPINTVQSFDYEHNNLNYKLFVHSFEDVDGQPAYIFAMTSLQPVDEAVRMMEDYSVYIVAFVLVLIVLVSFYYSKKFAKPLLRLNSATQKIALLDFSESIPVSSKDEIGELSRNINHLSATLHSYIDQLRQEIDKEKQLESTRKEFISGVSHELKTPLSVMKSCISILKDDVASDKKEHYFEAMENEVDKMDHLIVDMLELATFESGSYKMKLDIFPIDKTIESVYEQLAMDIAAKQLNVRLQLTPAEVTANPHRIEQVITNFMSNAIRYTPLNGLIIVSAIEDQGEIIVRVENYGVHIPHEQLEKVWDRFYRVDTARHRSHGGTGLGLAICKQILELHDSTYGVENTENGVAFFFSLKKA
ncbi:two-component sensor histidine kinase [Paenibacillus agaridevorans]|uniref:histidine kinase n=1 Tax=Paenibacillus agaridevorans TaxID=171404 RepID=A0A2R5ERD0_9BACL|nr:HAMP domain-containing sensor histidine kinase [Paenibacillus agaridevorans]GBG05961.1 two-component sensor histidine kinase [Paenibacillus agaridevorans]